MTYRAISNHLLRLGSNLGRLARIVEDMDHNVTGLYVEPIGWFLAVQDTGELDLGRRRAEDLRLAEARSIPFARVTPKMLGHELDLVLIEFVAHLIERSVQPPGGFFRREPVEECICHRIPRECQTAA